MNVNQLNSFQDYDFITSATLLENRVILYWKHDDDA